MIFASALSHELNIILGIATTVMLIGLLLKRLKQPYIIANILTGVLLGPSGFHLVTDFETAELIGELGLVVLMFFIGMEISLSDFIKKWRVAFFGTGMQVLFSILLTFTLGYFLNWPFQRILLLGFHSEIINSYTYQITVIVISITIFISPLWALGSKTMLERHRQSKLLKGR